MKKYESRIAALEQAAGREAAGEVVILRRDGRYYHPEPFDYSMLIESIAGNPPPGIPAAELEELKKRYRVRFVDVVTFDYSALVR